MKKIIMKILKIKYKLLYIIPSIIIFVVKKTRTRVKKVLDQDGDGKVTVKDAEVVASKATAKGKQIAAKTRGRKTASK